MVQEHYGDLITPAERDLVADDGFDALEKESAIRFFHGKTWHDLLQYLRSIAGSPTRGGAYMLEEWSVLEPRAITYYARAYLEHFLDTVESSEPDEFYVADFFGNLYQVVYSRRHTLLSSSQLEILRLAADRVVNGLWAPSTDPDFTPGSARRFLDELDAMSCERTGSTG